MPVMPEYWYYLPYACPQSLAALTAHFFIFDSNMSIRKTQAKVGRRSSIAFAFAFVGLLALPLLSFPFHGSSDRISEKRMAVGFPSISSGYKEFSRAFEKWFEDHFGFRSAMIRFYRQTRFELGLFGSSTQVVEGKDDWLFLSGGGEGDPLLAYSGAIRFEESELDQLQLYFEKWKSWLDYRGIAFLVLVAPNKVSIYPEHAPDSLPSSPYGTRTDQFLERMGKTDVSVLFPLEALVESKGNDSGLYYKLDTHWNAKGAFTAYRELTQGLPGSNRFLGSDFRLTENRRSGGDLSDMLGVESEWKDVEYRVELARGKWAEEKGDWSAESMLTYRFENGDDSLPRALIVHDSFMESMAGLLARHFRESKFVSDSYLDSEKILEEKPDIVILEFAERFLYQYTGASLPPFSGLKR